MNGFRYETSTRLDHEAAPSTGENRIPHPRGVLPLHVKSDHVPVLQSNRPSGSRGYSTSSSRYPL